MLTGRIIDSSDYLKSLIKVIGPVIKYGETIIIGRGSNIIVGLDRGFHLRVTASVNKRAENLARREKIDSDKAEERVTESDRRKANYFKKSFGIDINDSAIYDLILNTEYYAIDDAVELAFLAYEKKAKLLLSN
jgi:cytidylate kinase